MNSCAKSDHDLIPTESFESGLLSNYISPGLCDKLLALDSVIIISPGLCDNLLALGSVINLLALAWGGGLNITMKPKKSIHVPPGLKGLNKPFNARIRYFKIII